MNQNNLNDNPLSPSGRFGRLSYLGWSVLITILAFPFLLFALFLLNISAYGIEAPNAFLGLVVLIFIVIYLFFSYFNFIFMIRRLHDLDQSGWLSLLIFVPVGNIVLFLYLIFAKGNEGTNKFGPQRMTKQWEKVLGWIYILFIPLIGILAAISIPAYQNYVERAQMQQFEQIQQQHQDQ